MPPGCGRSDMDLDEEYIVLSSPDFISSNLRLLLKGRVDLILANGDPAALLSMMWKSKGVPVLYDMQGLVADEFVLMNNRIGMKPLLLSKLFIKKSTSAFDRSLSDRITCVSHRMVEYLEKRGVSPERISYVTNGVDLERFKPVSEDTMASVKERYNLSGKMIFGYIGGTQSYQGINQLMEAAHGVSDEHIAFLVAGGRFKAREGNILFMPFASRGDATDYYALCDVFVLPRVNSAATQVAAPTKFAEYSAMGKPILTSAVGDAAELVRKYSSGIVVATNSPTDLIKGIKNVASLTSEKVEQMGRQSRLLAETEFDWALVHVSLIDAIEKTVSRKARGR
jgi:glycosyltransferase involved in cell wall biosynthesis